MTTAEQAGLVSYIEAARVTSGPVPSTAPNGSSSSINYWTTITYRQVWVDCPANGIYAGRVYRTTERWISPSPDHLGQFVSSDSQPW